MEWSLLFVLNSILLGVGLAMDAFSVSLANGLNEPFMRKKKMCGIAGVFGFFQALMPMAASDAMLPRRLPIPQAVHLFKPQSRNVKTFLLGDLKGAVLFCEREQPPLPRSPCWHAGIISLFIGRAFQALPCSSAN